MFSWVHGLQVGSKNRSKIEQKSITRWKGLPTSIFSGFWWIWEAKLAPSWDEKSINNCKKKASNNKCQKEGDKIGKNRGLEASWPEKADGICTGTAATWRPRRMRVGLSKADICRFCSSVLNTPMAALPGGRGWRIANACGDHRRPLIF